MVPDVSNEGSGYKTFGEEGDTLLRNVDNNETMKHHAPEDDIPPLHHCSQQFCLFLREVMWHSFAVTRHVAQREISQKAGGVHCYCWRNLGWCLCAFIVHGVRIIERWCLSFCPSECLSVTSLGLHKLSIGVAALKSCREFNFVHTVRYKYQEDSTSIVLRQYYK